MKKTTIIILSIVMSIAIVMSLQSCESDDRTISVYELKYCDGRKSEQVYCSSIYGMPATIDTWKQAVPVFNCRDLNNNYFRKLNVCDTTLISRSISGE